MKKLVIALFCCMATTMVFAADWTLVSDREGVEEYVDYKNVEKNGDLHQLWTLFNFKARTIRMNKSGDSKNPEYVIAKSILGHREFDCKNRRYRMLESRGFDGLMGNGKEVAVYLNKEVIWNPIKAASFEDTIYKKVCEK